MEVFEISPSGDEILCVDRFIGDENFHQLCERIEQRNSSFSNATSLILRGNCLGKDRPPVVSFLDSQIVRSSRCTIIISIAGDEWFLDSDLIGMEPARVRRLSLSVKLIAKESNLTSFRFEEQWNQ
jgi:hypothetical protein